MTLFEVMAKIGLNKDGFDKGIKEATNEGRSLQDSLSNSFSKIKKAAKAFLTAALFKEVIEGAWNFANEVAAVGDQIDKQSQVLGLSRKAYQEWGYILSQNGASIENMSAAMKTLNSLTSNAAEGSKEAKNAFVELGLNIHEFEKLSPEEQFEAVVKQFQKMPAGAKKTELAMKYFGRQGQQLLPLLNSSADSIEELKKKAEELGLVMDDETVDASVHFTDSLDTLKRSWNAFKYSIGGKILEPITKGMEKLTSYVGKLKKAYEQGGLKGVATTLIEDLKKNWPTWDQIKSWVVEKWKAVQEGFTNIAKLVFGEDEDGNIKWPTYTEIQQKVSEGLTKLWGAVQDVAKGIMKLIFGEDENGDIAWPTPEEIKEKVKKGLQDMWDGVKTLAKTILKLIFGEGKDGDIEFPSGEELWNKIKETLGKIWEYVKGAAVGILQFIFGEDEEGGIQWPTAEQIWNKLKEGLSALWEGIKDFAKGILKFIFGETEDGGIKWPTAKEIWAKVKKGFTDMWNGVKNEIGKVTELIFGENTVIGKGLRDAFDWCKEKINEVKRFLGLRVEGELTKGEIEQLKYGYYAAQGDPKELEESGWVKAFRKQLGDAGFKADQIDTLVYSIVHAPNPEWGAALLDDLNNSTDSAERLKTVLQDIAKLNVTYTMNSGQYSNWYYGNHHAKGLDTVPFDDYPARLHRGEMVLTASQARQYRDGGNGIDTQHLVTSIVGAIRSGMNGVQVKSYINGRDITDEVNRNTMRELKARRFAT